MRTFIAQDRLSTNGFLSKPPPHPHHPPHHPRPRGGGRGGGFLYPETYYLPYPYPYPAEPVESVTSEVEAFTRRNECIVLRRATGPTYVRRTVIDALKARGWDERIDVQGGVKVLLLCPPAAQTARIQGLGVIRSLGQTVGNISTARILVQDLRDKPFSGISITVTTSKGQDIASGKTGSNGTTSIAFSTEEDHVNIVADLPEGSVVKYVPVSQADSEVLTFRSIEKAPIEIVTPLEIGAAVGGAAFFALGMAMKVQPLEILGEILVVAAIFERVGRGL